MDELSAAKQIDAIITMHDDWRGDVISRLRAIIKKTDPQVVEEVKWKKPSKPEGVPVWTHAGTVCLCDTLKNAVRLTFPKGAQLTDPTNFFNVRLDSKTVRAIDIYENDQIDEDALAALVIAAVKINDKGDL
jgi:hypothetical protein